MRVVVGALAGWLLVLPAVAEPNARPSAPRGSADLAYAGYVAGLNMLNVRAGFELRPDGYELGIGFRTSGLVGALLHGDMLSRVEGSWRGDRAVPRSYVSAGTWRGDPREIVMEYPSGQPVIKALVPQQDQEREPVPDELRRDTTDALSAIALLLHNVAATGRCEGTASTFDGRRVSQVTARTVGTEVLPPESRSSFSGPALRCDLEGRQVAGFPKDAGANDMLRRTQHSSVWLATLQPGMPPVPVLMSFEVRLLGHMTLYVTKAQQGAQLAQFTPRVQ